MAYSLKAAVKVVLHIKATDLTHDTEIDGCITDGDAWIDEELKEYTTVPLTGTIPTIIEFASKYRAAALFKEKEESKKATVL